MGKEKLRSRDAAIIDKQFAALLRVYPRFERVDQTTLRGTLPFSATYQNDNIQDSFEIEITVSRNFYKTAPVVKDISGRTSGYHHINPDGTFCLGAPIAVQIKFQKSGSLIEFIQGQVIPFLYTFCIWKRDGRFPYGDLKHGGAGIIQFYREEFFGVDSDVKVLRLLRLNVERNFLWNDKCPCDSGKSFRTCHRLPVLEIRKRQSFAEQLEDYKSALKAYVAYGTEIP